MAENATIPKGSKDAEQHRQLLVHHIGGLRQMLPSIDAAKEALKALQEDFTSKINAAKADLGKGYTRKYMMSLLEDASSRLRNLLEEEERRAADRSALGLPVYGVQADLFSNATAAMPDEARDEIHYEAEGYMRGRAGLLEEIPEGTSPRFHQAVQRGYAAGQKATQEDYLAGQELIAKRGAPDADAEAGDLNPEPDLDDPEVVDDKVRQLRRKGFMNKSGADAEQPSAA